MSMLVRSCLCIVLIASAVFTLAQSSVSYRTVAKSTGKILQDLSPLTGKSLKAAADVSKLILIVSIKGRPVQEVLDNLAKATLARWEKKKNELWLVADAPARREREKVFLAKQDRVFRDFIAG